MVTKSDSSTSVYKNDRPYDPKAKSPVTPRFIMISLIIVLIIVGYFVAGKGVFTSEDGFLPANPMMHKDRSSTYNVRVLPASMSDEELDKLPKDAFSYLAMIDAGSSGCRAHVYRYGKLGTLSGPLYILPAHVSKKIKPGLSSFAKSPHAAGQSLQQLVEFVKEQVPEALQATTPIWLKATAGLRLVPGDVKEGILASVRQFLGSKANSPFIFRPSYAAVIPGSEEGGFGWIAYNYLQKIIGPKAVDRQQAPYAVVEMGGASAQVTQAARTKEEIAQIPAKYRFDFSIEGDNYVLYTNSYLGYGAEAARDSLNKYYLANSKSREVKAVPEAGSSGITIKDTCLNSGYRRAEAEKWTGSYSGAEGRLEVVGASSAGTCSADMHTLFQPVDTISDKCNEEGPYSFRCIYQPDFVRSSEKFLIFENFYYVASAIGITSVDPTAAEAFPLLTSPSKIRQAADRVCGLNLDSMNQSYPKDKSGKEENIKWCFGASYAASFLVDGLKLDENKSVTIQQKVGASDVEWALGAAYKEAADFLKRTNLRPT